MEFQRLEINGGRIEGSLPWKLEIPANQDGYSNAQLDDYHGLKRSAYLWNPGVHLSIRARFSASSQQLLGTAGFGFWNAPFGDPTVRMPAFPKAAWFFFGSEPNDHPYSVSQPGKGWFVSTLCSSTAKGLSLMPAAPAIVLLNQFQSIRIRVWPKICSFLGMAISHLAVQMDQWHQYELYWRREGCTFWIDNELVMETGYSPTGPLGFVCWIDNQYLAAKPTGRIRIGTLSLADRQWLEIESLVIGKISD